jgi:hypothetical protein
MRRLSVEDLGLAGRGDDQARVILALSTLRPRLDHFFVSFSLSAVWTTKSTE